MKFALLIAAASAFTCPNPQVTTCYKATKKDCFDAMSSADKDTATSLKGLEVEPGMDKLLLKGSEFTEMFTWTTEGDDVYLAVLEFERLGYLQDIQLALMTLQLNGASDPKYASAHDTMNIEMTNIFQDVCWATVINKPTDANVKFLQ